MSRRDGRKDHDIRQLALESGLLSRADGSAKFSCGPVTVLGSVAGPMEVRLRDELVDRAALEINVRPIRGLPGPSTKALVDSLESVLKPVLLLNRHPRALVQLSLQTIGLPSTRYSKPFRTFAEPDAVTQDDEERVVDEELASGEAQPESVVEKAAAINAATCSLVDAAIDMKATICAVGLAIPSPSTNVPESLRVLLDPSAEEERDAQATLCVAFAFGEGSGGFDGDVCYFDMSKGFVDDEQLAKAIDVARSACKTIHAFIRKSQEVRYTEV